MSVTLDCTSAPFVRCGKKTEINYDDGDSGTKKCKRGYGGAYDGVWRESELWSQAVGFMLVQAGIWLQSQ
jgi:hypothetical protein